MQHLQHVPRACERVGSVGICRPPTWAEVSATIDTAAAQGVRLIEKLGRPRDWRVQGRRP